MDDYYLNSSHTNAFIIHNTFKYRGEDVSINYFIDLLKRNTFDNYIEVIFFNNYYLFYHLKNRYSFIFSKFFKYNYYIVRFCKLEIILLFIDNATFFEQRKGLHVTQAAILSNDIEKVKLLINHLSNPNIILTNHNTLLHIAIKLGNFEIIDELIQNGCDLNHETKPIKYANEITFEYLGSKYACDVCYEIKPLNKTKCGCSFKYCFDCKIRIGNKCCACGEEFMNMEDMEDIVSEKDVKNSNGTHQ